MGNLAYSAAFMYETAGTRWLRPIVVAVLLLAAAACSDDPPPAGAVRSTTPSVQSSTPTPTETPVEQQVEAAVRAYYAELTRAAQTLDTTTLKTLTRGGCPCSGSARSIDNTRKSGHKIPDAAWTVQKLRVHDVIAQSAGAEVWYFVAAYQVLDGKGQIINSFPKRVKHVDLTLLTERSHWRISNVFDLGG
jgi:hypothetical protein